MKAKNINKKNRNIHEKNINNKNISQKDKVEYKVNSRRLEKNKKQRYDIAKKEHIENTVNITKIVIKVVLIIAFVLSIIYISCRYIGNIGLIVKEYPIDYERLPDSFYGLKIIQISDINYNNKTTNMNKVKYLIEKVNTLEPDIVVFTGDLIYGDVTQNELNQLESYLSNLEAKIGKYAVFGEDDDTAKILVKNAGFIDIENNYDLIYSYDYETIMINGISEDFPDTKQAFAYLDNNDNNYIFTISLVHRPDMVTNLLNEHSVDLVLSGHSLGGQIYIPGIGGLIKINGANDYINNYYQINNTDLYVSSGLGTRKYPFRFLNHPSINLFRLK